jgi:ATPase family AAA domain-containing protein 1
MSTLSQKWFGESERLVDAVFSLAHKLQPAIIFIDEIDSFLRERTASDHEVFFPLVMLCDLALIIKVTGNMKAGFMTRWDGLMTEEDSRIIVLGATNLPNSLDPAVLRRLPKRYPIGLPNAAQRRKILDIFLKKAALAPDFSMDRLIAATDGFSGSDIKEVCRNAAMIPLREYLKIHGQELEQRQLKSGFELRPLTTNDFLHEAE